MGWAALCEAHRGGDRREEMRFAELTASYGGTERPWDGLRCAKPIGVGIGARRCGSPSSPHPTGARSGRGMGCAVRSPSGWGSARGDAVRRAHRILRGHGAAVGWAALCEAHRGGIAVGRCGSPSSPHPTGGTERPWDGLRCSKPIGAGAAWGDAVRRAHRILRGRGAAVGWAEPCEAHRGGIAVGRCGSPSSPHPTGARSDRRMG